MTKLKTIEVKKIWFGDETYKKPKVTLRSYQIEPCINYGVRVIYKSKYMDITPAELKIPIGKRFFKSKIGAEDYYLLDYFWDPKN